MSPLAAIAVIGSSEFRALVRRRWFFITVAVGLVLIVAGTIFAFGDDGQMRSDALRSWTLAVEVIGGLVIAASLGSSAGNRDADGGWLGIQVASGVGRSPVMLGRIVGRTLALVAAFAAWIIVAAICSLIVGNGIDGPLVVTGLAGIENMLVVLTVAALCSVAIGPVAAGVTAGIVYVFVQALVNLASAAEANVIGTSWTGLMRTLYFIFPRGIVSPMVADLQARDVAGLAAPRVVVNGNIVFIQPSSWGSVIWTLGWCVLLAFAAAGAIRKRALS